MRSLLQICLKRPIAVLMLLVAVLLLSVIGAGSLPISRLPKIDTPRVLVDAAWPGMSAVEIRSLVAKPLEDGLAVARGLVKMRSVSRDGRCLIQLDFAWGEKSAKAASRIRELVDTVYPSLPEGAARPQVFPDDSQSGPLVVLALEPKSGSLDLTRRIAEYDVKSRLRQTDGVGSVTLSGASPNEIAVLVDITKAAARQMDTAGVAKSLSQEYADIPAGSVREGRFELPVIAKGRVTSPEALGKFILAGPAGPFRLDDIARIYERPSRQQSLFLYNGKEQICMEIFARADADPVGTAARIRETVKSLERDFGKDISFAVVRDDSSSIASSVQGLAVAALLGAAAAIGILFVSLRNFRAGLLVALTIPLSIAIGLLALVLAKKSLNSMSLGGLGLAIGMISDNAVVIIDAILAKCKSSKTRPDIEIMCDAILEVSGGTFGSTLTTAVVFIPVMFLPGVMGALFGDLALSLISAIVAGWLLAVFAVPSFFRVLWYVPENHGSGKLERVYRKSLIGAFRRPLAVFVIAIACTAAGTLIIVQRPANFMPADAISEYVVTVNFPAGTGMDRMKSDGSRIEAELSGIGGLGLVYGFAGAESYDTTRRADPSWSANQLVFSCFLKNGSKPEAAESALVSALNTALPADCEYLVLPAIDPAARLLGLGGQSGLVVSGSDPETVKARCADFIGELEKAAGPSLSSARISPGEKQPRLVVSPLKDRSATIGMDGSKIAMSIGYATEGMVIGSMEIAGISKDIRVAADPYTFERDQEDNARYFSSIDSLRMLPVLVEESVMPAGVIANFSEDEVPAALARLDRKDVLFVQATPSADGKKELAKAVESTRRGLDYVADYNESALKEHAKSLVLTIFLVIVLLYLVLSAQFESLRLPVLIMTTIPLAISGAGPILLLGGAGLDSGSVLGLIVLFGVAVNNAIIMYETSKLFFDNGKLPVVAAYLGAAERIRPILATTGTTLVALLPMVLFSAGAAQKSMSLAMLGGLFASTLLSLFAAPLLFRYWLAKGIKHD